MVYDFITHGVDFHSTPHLHIIMPATLMEMQIHTCCLFSVFLTAVRGSFCGTGVKNVKTGKNPILNPFHFVLNTVSCYKQMSPAA